MASNVSELINQGISKEIVVQLNCPECGGIQLVRDMKMGEIVCCGCGLVIREDYVYSGPEYITFTPEEMKSRVRVGSPTSYHRFDKGLSTVIRVERDAFGRPLSHAYMQKSGVSSEVEGLAIKIIRDAKNKHATSGKDPTGLAAIALCIAAKLKKEKMKESQFAKAANITEVTIRNRKRALMRDLNLEFI